MNANTIECPKCQTRIEVNQALTSQISAQLRQELQAEADARRVAMEKQASALAAQKQALDKAQADIEQQVKERVDAERAALLEQAKKTAAEDLAVELRERDERVGELQTKLKTAQEAELALRKREREMEQKAENAELEIARRLKVETDQAREEARKQAAEEHELKAREQQEKIAGMTRQIDELKRRAEQGSQQSQGEALELILEDVLARKFPLDEVTAVSKGVNGADILQQVRTPSGLECGGILWETKNAKNWSPGWLPKLRADQREAKAAIAVLVTEVMPVDAQHLTQIDDVWVCTRSCAAGLAMALRTGLIELALTRRAADGKQGKTELMYDYLTGMEFRQRVMGLAEPLILLQDGLAKEKRAMERIWAARSKQLEMASNAVVGLYGDLQGIAGESFPTLEPMELPEIPDASELNGPAH